MELVLTAEQKMIRDGAVPFFQSRGGVRRLRELRDEARQAVRAPTFSREVWAAMAELGWLGLGVPEAFGGLGLGLAERVVVLEAAGRALAPEPLVGSACLVTDALVLCGSEAQRAAWLPRLVSGELTGAFASEERGSRGEPERCEAAVVEVEGGLHLSGHKVDVLGGAEAGFFVVTARHEGALGGWIVPADAPGVRVLPLDRVDAFPAAEVIFERVSVDGASRLPEPAALALVLDRARVALAAEMLGAMSAALEVTLAYLKERQQFGVPIGSFQALKHRAARCFVELELARSTVMAGARVLDEVQAGAGGAVLSAAMQASSLAKARCSEAFALIAAEAVQMHGGIGMTDEHDIGFYYKRAKVAAATLGDASFHRDRWARLAGY